jgi:hypothetical protein
VPNSKVPAGLNPGPVVLNPLNDLPESDKEPLQGPLASAAELKDPID